MSCCTNRPTPWGQPPVAVTPTPAAPVILVDPAPAPAPTAVAPPPAPPVVTPVDPASAVILPTAVPSQTYRRPTPRKPVYARDAGKSWSQKEQTLVEHAFRVAGLTAAYNAVPHRTPAAVRGWLQRRGLIAKTPAAPAVSPI